MRTGVAGALGLVAGLASWLSFSTDAHGQTGVTTTTGALADGATYLIQVPAG